MLFFSHGCMPIERNLSAAHRFKEQINPKRLLGQNVLNQTLATRESYFLISRLWIVSIACDAMLKHFSRPLLSYPRE